MEGTWYRRCTTCQLEGWDWTVGEGRSRPGARTGASGGRAAR